jgi:hypothetical protein
MTESGRDLKATIDRTYYVPNTPDLPADSNGGSAYNVNNYHVAIFQVDDQDSGETGAGIKDWNFAVDAQAGVGNLIALPNSQLSTYGFEAYFDYNGVSFALSENTNQSYPKAGYDDYGTNVSLSNHVATIVIPENRPQAELQVSGTSTTTTATGGDKLTGLAKGDSKSTSGGTTVTVDDITYTATCGAAAGSSCTPSEAVVVVPLSGDLVQTDALPAAGKVVIVGGYLVNSLAKGIGLEDKLKVAGDKVAEKLDNGNIVVAGYTAADTGAAAQELIDELTALLG